MSTGNEKPIYEFRPLPNFFDGEVRRYANGKWIPDDGEYDLAFIGQARTDKGWTYPCCLMVELPHQKNIVCSWYTRSWGDFEPRHPRGNAWHYALTSGAKDWGGSWGDYYNHPNRRAGDSGMSTMASENGCANGSHVEFHADDRHIASGLLRRADTKEVFSWPDDLACMYCGDSPNQKIEAVQEQAEVSRG